MDGCHLAKACFDLSGILKAIPCRYVLSVMIFFGLVNVYAMRVNLSVAILAMMKNNDYSIVDNFTSSSDLCPSTNGSTSDEEDESSRNGDIDWTATQKGNVLGAFFYGYVVMNIIGGRLTEKIGSKWMYGFGLLAVSVLTLLSPLVAGWSYYAFLALRVLVGLFEGASFPAFHCMLGRWIPVRERGLVYMCIQTGATVGNSVGDLLAGILCQSSFLGGWPSSFYVFGFFGVIWCIFWFALMHEYPQDHPRMSSKERAYIITEFNKEGHSQKNIPLPWKEMIKSLPLWAAIIVMFGSNWLASFDVLEWPTFLNTVLHYNLANTGIWSSLPDLIALVVSIFASAAGDWLLRKGYLSVTGTRKLLTFLGAAPFIPYTIAVVYERCNGGVIIALRIFYSVSNSLSSPGYTVSLIDMAPTFAGTIMGLANGLTQTTGFIIPAFVSAVSQGKGNLYPWHVIFYINMAVFIATTVFYLVFGSSVVQPWCKVPHETKEETPNPEGIELPPSYDVASEKLP